MNNNLPTDLWVTAHIRKCNAQSIPAYVLNKGAAESGTIVVKVLINSKNCKIFSQSRDFDGNIAWLDVYEGENIDESRADSYIKRVIDRDPDVWVLEIEDASGKNPFEGKII